MNKNCFQKIRWIAALSFILLACFYPRLNWAALKVVSTTPEEGADDVSYGPILTIKFNHSLDPDTVNLTHVRLEPAEGGKAVESGLVLIGNNDVIIFQPHEFLKPDKDYRLIVGKKIADLNGAHLSERFELNFSTGSNHPPAEPKVTRTTPGSGAQDVRLDSQIKVHFSELMDPKSIYDWTLTLYRYNQNNDPVRVPVRLQALSAPSHDAIFIPEEGLKKNAQYAAIVSNYPRSTAGMLMYKTHSWYFTAGAVPPETVGWVDHVYYSPEVLPLCRPNDSVYPCQETSEKTVWCPSNQNIGGKNVDYVATGLLLWMGDSNHSGQEAAFSYADHVHYDTPLGLQLYCSSVTPQGLSEYPEKVVNGGTTTGAPVMAFCPDDYVIVGFWSMQSGLQLICSPLDLSEDDSLDLQRVRSTKMGFWKPYSNDAAQSASLHNHMANVASQLGPDPSQIILLPDGAMMVGVNLEKHVQPYFEENRLLFLWSIWGVKLKKTY